MNRAKKRKSTNNWQPLIRAHFVKALNEAQVQEIIKRTGYDEVTARDIIKKELNETEYWINDLYQVSVHYINYKTPMVQINIRRRDGRAIFRDWRHFQEIKNQIVGKECEGVELYPAESRLNDTSNKYHIWCYTNPKYRFPFGMETRDIYDDDGNRTPGLRQRKL